MITPNTSPAFIADVISGKIETTLNNITRHPHLPYQFIMYSNQILIWAVLAV